MLLDRRSQRFLGTSCLLPLPLRANVLDGGDQHTNGLQVLGELKPLARAVVKRTIAGAIGRGRCDPRGDKSRPIRV